MLEIEKDSPAKDTLFTISKFSKFSLIEKIEPRFFATSTEASIKVAEIIRDTIKSKN